MRLCGCCQDVLGAARKQGLLRKEEKPEDAPAVASAEGMPFVISIAPGWDLDRPIEVGHLKIVIPIPRGCLMRVCVCVRWQAVLEAAVRKGVISDNAEGLSLEKEPQARRNLSSLSGQAPKKQSDRAKGQATRPTGQGPQKQERHKMVANRFPSTTAYITDEATRRQKRKQRQHGRDMVSVGSMSLSVLASIGISIALSQGASDCASKGRSFVSHAASHSVGVTAI